MFEMKENEIEDLAITKPLPPEPQQTSHQLSTPTRQLPNTPQHMGHEVTSSFLLPTMTVCGPQQPQCGTLRSFKPSHDAPCCDIKRLSASDSGRGSSGSDSGSQNGDQPYTMLPHFPRTGHTYLPSQHTSSFQNPNCVDFDLNLLKQASFPTNKNDSVYMESDSELPPPKGRKLIQYCDELIAELETMAH